MTSLTPIIFDIETGPLPQVQLDAIKPVFVANRTLRDPDKIKADLAEKEATWREKAALSSITGQILAVGLIIDDTPIFLDSEDERQILSRFWWEWSTRTVLMIGFAIRHFDLPFLFQRSLILNVDHPADLFEGGRWWNHRAVDLQDMWCCYTNKTEGQSLGAVCGACGLGRKNGDGASFAGLFATDRAAALDYLKNDLELTSRLAQRFHLL